MLTEEQSIKKRGWMSPVSLSKENSSRDGMFHKASLSYNYYDDLKPILTLRGGSMY